MARERADAPPAGHLPVMFAQVMEGLGLGEDGTAVHGNGVWLDGTYGRGGHARGMLERLGPEARLLLMDKDPEAIAHARQALGGDPRVQVRQGSFAELAQWEHTAQGLDGVLFDLGVSSPQLDRAERGFSFQNDGPLDMRMDPSSGESAADWLARAQEQEIAEVLWTYGEERMGRRIAQAIVARRAEQPLRSTGQLAELLAAVVGRRGGERKGRHKHPATRTFQALRIHVNRELADLEQGLAAAHARLRSGGRLAVISFHSLEDRIVKRFIAARARPPSGNRRLPEPLPFQPSLREIGGAMQAEDSETLRNPRARSAVLRVAERLA